MSLELVYKWVLGDILSNVEPPLFWVVIRGQSLEGQMAWELPFECLSPYYLLQLPQRFLEWLISGTRQVRKVIGSWMAQTRFLRFQEKFVNRDEEDRMLQMDLRSKKFLNLSFYYVLVPTRSMSFSCGGNLESLGSYKK